nr:alpha/beta hydrolase [Flavilitoribacter nigricans]
MTFVHGAGGSSSIWFRQLRDFRKHFNVLLVDLRGHGKSKKPIYEKLKEYTFDKIGDEVIEVLDHLQIRSTHFVGISLGTIIIREITERYPERTRSMIMGGAVMKLNLRGQILMRLGVLLKSVVPYLLLYRFFAFIIMPRKKHRESRNLFINEAKKLYQKEFKRWFTLVAEVNPLLKWFRIKDAGIPTLYIMGSEDHMFLPSITKLVQDHDSSELFVIPDCGHVVNVERPDVFNNKAIHFLQQLD